MLYVLEDGAVLDAVDAAIPSVKRAWSVSAASTSATLHAIFVVNQKRLTRASLASLKCDTMCIARRTGFLMRPAGNVCQRCEFRGVTLAGIVMFSDCEHQQ